MVRKWLHQKVTLNEILEKLKRGTTGSTDIYLIGWFWNASVLLKSSAKPSKSLSTAGSAVLPVFVRKCVTNEPQCWGLFCIYAHSLPDFNRMKLRLVFVCPHQDLSHRREALKLKLVSHLQGFGQIIHPLWVCNISNIKQQMWPVQSSALSYCRRNIFLLLLFRVWIIVQHLFSTYNFELLLNTLINWKDNRNTFWN